MQKRIPILISAIALAISAGAQVGAIDRNRPHREHEHEHEKKQKYTCPMHPEVVMDHPGNCPKCGMTLVPIKAKTHETHAAHAGAHTSHESHQPMSMQS